MVSAKNQRKIIHKFKTELGIKCLIFLRISVRIAAILLYPSTLCVVNKNFVEMQICIFKVSMLKQHKI